LKSSGSKESGRAKAMQYSIILMEDGLLVPIHKSKDVAKGTLHKILKDAGLSYEEFKKIK